jgi:hypothetical protein
MEETAEKQQDISRVPPQLQPHVFKKGQSGNPAGRPPTSTLKEFARKYLAGLTDEERIEFFEGIDKKVIWEMAEGKPETKSDITTNGESINPVLIKFIDANNRDTSGVQETV